MPRPKKFRRVCSLPQNCGFQPLLEEQTPPVVMTVDEYETIRLIDWEGLTQEECAQQMDVARATIAAIWGEARQKLAEALVLHKKLIVSGGNYAVCPLQPAQCTRRLCCGQTAAPLISDQPKGDSLMKIAATYEDGQIFQHFGHTEQFKIYTITDDKITDMAIVPTNGSGHGALAHFLQEQGVGILICGGIGGGARTALANAGIAVFAGASGEADLQVGALLAGMLAPNPDITCAHHDHDHAGGHDCGSHACGGSCGSCHGA